MALDIFEEIEEEVNDDELEKIIENEIKVQEKKENQNTLLLLNYNAFLAVIKKDYNTSINYFEKIAEIQPKNIWILNFKAASYNEIEKYEKAKEILEKAQSIKENQYSNLLMGIAHYETGNYFRAVREMTKAGELFYEFISEDYH